MRTSRYGTFKKLDLYRNNMNLMKKDLSDINFQIDLFPWRLISAWVNFRFHDKSVKSLSSFNVVSVSKRIIIFCSMTRMRRDIKT